MSEEKIDAPNVLNQERDRRYNMEPSLLEVPGTPYAMEMAKFERPYQFRPYPKMLYKAERRGGKIMCMESAPDRYSFSDDRAFILAEESARVFTDKCQTVVYNETEHSQHMEMGWRESAAEAVAFINAKEDEHSLQVAHRNHDDRNLSEKAKAEIARAEAEAGEPLAEIERTPGRKSRKVA